MRHFHRSSLALLGLSVLAPSAVQAQGVAPAAPAGYAAPMMGLDGRPLAPMAAPAPAPAAVAMPAPAAPHAHKGRRICASCRAKEAQAQAMMGGQVVACSHSKNGVCPACQAVLAMPGTMVVNAPVSAEAPGRAVASSGMAPAQGGPQMAARAGSNVQVSYDPSAMPEPAPVGVVQANFAQGGGMPPMGMGMPAGPGMPSPAGRAVATSGAGSSPYQPKMDGSPNPHVLGHLFGWSGIGADRAEQRARRKSETHASIPYNNEGTTINDLPASMVYPR